MTIMQFFIYSLFPGVNKTLETYKAHVPPSLDINHTKEQSWLFRYYSTSIFSFNYDSRCIRNSLAGIVAGIVVGIVAAAISFSVGGALRRRWPLR